MPTKSEKMREIIEKQRKIYQSNETEITNGNIKNINIEELSDKELAQMCFHYSLKKDKNSIDRDGLQTKIGRNSERIDKLKSIYFSYGIEGVLETWDVWLKWRANRLGNPHFQEENKEIKEAIKNRTATEQEKKEYWYKRKLWNDEFISERYKEDKEKINFLYDFQMEEMQASNYYVLDLKEGEDFSFDEIDVKKQANLALKDTSNNMTYKLFREMYGKYSNFDSSKVDKWNMNTFLGKQMTIEPERIKQLVLPNGKNDVLSVITYLYDKYKEITPKEEQVEFDLLDGYMEHTKERMKEQMENNMSSTELDIKQILEKLVDEKGEPKLPEGWTYLIHGTNTSQWNKEILEGSNFIVRGNEAGLYCVERENAILNQQMGSDVSKLHSQMKQLEGEKDFEIRCLIYKDLRRQKYREELEGRLTQEEIDDVNNYHIKKPYYPAIPNNTKLIKLTTTEFDEITNSEKDILWYIPEKYLEHYLEECGVKTKDELEMSTNTKKIDNLEVITEKVDEYTKETRKLNGIEIASTKEFEDGSYDKKSRVFIADKGINVSSDYINYTTFRSQYDSKINTYIDTTQSPLIDDNGNVIGETQYIETNDMQNGIREGHEYKTIEGEKGIFQIETTQKSQGDNYSELSIMNIDNKLSGNKEQVQYLNENGKETYVYMENGVVGQKITKTERGTTIDIYKDGQPYETFEYDEDGKAIIQMAGLEQLPDDYVKSQFDIVIPEYKTVSHELPEELYADMVQQQEQQNETNQQISTSKLGKETLEEQKNVSQMDRVQLEIEEQLTQSRDNFQINEFGEIIRPKSDSEKSFRDEVEPQEKSDNGFRDGLKAKSTTDEQVEFYMKEFEKGIEEPEDVKKKINHKVEKLDNEHIM